MLTRLVATPRLGAHAQSAFGAGSVAALLSIGACSGDGPAPPPVVPVAATASSPPTEPAAPRPGGCPAATAVGLVARLEGPGPDADAIVYYEHAFRDGVPAGLLPQDGRARTLGEADARRFGVPVERGSVWVFPDGERSACRLEPRERRVLVGAEPWERVPLVVLVLEGTCPDVDTWRGRLAVRAEAGPPRCRVGRPTPTAEPLARTARAPSDLRAALDPTTCRAPGCELRWATRSFASGARRLEWTAVTRIHPQADATECFWPMEDTFALLAEPNPGAPLDRVDTHGLDEVLVDESSAPTVAAFVDRDVLRFDVWAWPAGASPRRARTVLHGWAHEEDARESLGPECGP